MQRTREFKNIGTVVTSKIMLSDTTMSLFIPLETESDLIRAEREKFENWVLRDVKKENPDINFDDCILNTETDLYINTGCCDKNGRYEMYFSIGFIVCFMDADGKEIYWDSSDGFEIELSEEDKAYLKKVMALKIVDALF